MIEQTKPYQANLLSFRGCQIRTFRGDADEWWAMPSHGYEDVDSLIFNYYNAAVTAITARSELRKDF